jgi:hypothetical protein
MTHESSRSSRPKHVLRASFAATGLFALFGSLGTGCLDRPVAPVEPRTTNTVVIPLIQQVVDKIDLLFMIDNSGSMADKQRILEDAVPELLKRLITPRCVDSSDNLTNDTAPNCPPGTRPEFDSIDDIHIGVVTSSLGGHGADQCSPAVGDEYWNPSMDDKGQLLPTVPIRDRSGTPRNIPQFQNTGFLAWDPGGKYGGETNSDTLIANFRAQVAAVGEEGCGFESSLEAWYRFLIEPDPIASVEVRDNKAIVTRGNRTVLEQRARFLRPDSLVAIVMLSDENDCSTRESEVSWLAGQSGGGYHLPRATDICARNPNDRCCRSCASLEDRPPENCAPLNADPGCTTGSHNDETDEINLRCWNQKRRFGIDFLYGIDRYVRGLTQFTVLDHNNKEVDNPLYSDLSGQNLPSRKQSLVFLAGIVGVPWQDIATKDTLNDPMNLKYMKASELTAERRWDMILGDPANGVLPTDALMIESMNDRTTLQGVNPAHPLGLGNLVPTPAIGQMGGGNPINGNEYKPQRFNDLQYACIFDLPASVECGATVGCDCSTGDQGTGKPLCNGTQQVAAKAYPGLRHLQVLKGVSQTSLQKDNAIVASICPKLLDNQASAAYGYNPAVASIIDALKVQLGGQCLPRPLKVNDAGVVPCVVVEALHSPNGTCDCDPARGRAELVGDGVRLINPVRDQLAQIDHCGPDTGRSCEEFCLCEIKPVQPGNAETTCLTNPQASNSGDQYGYCYVDPKRGRGSDAVLEGCPSHQRRKIQFIGENTPANGSTAFIACLGQSVTDGEGNVDGGR